MIVIEHMWPTLLDRDNPGNAWERVVIIFEGEQVVACGAYYVHDEPTWSRHLSTDGLGNPEALNSASHGAGRVLSRSKAKAKYTVDDLIAQTAGVECRKDAGVLDEIPAAYKDIDVVMANQSDLVEIQHELRAVMCVKG